MKFLLGILLVCTITNVHAEYNRADYKVWSDFNHNCFNTRHELLNNRAIIVPWIKNCQVKAGIWQDAYDGKTLKNLKLIDIDHVIPLYYADSHGLANELKPAFGNDTDNLLITSASNNRSKGSKSISQWHPNYPYLCKYAEIWQDIGSKYNITFDKQDDDFIFKTLLECTATESFVNNSLHK